MKTKSRTSPNDDLLSEIGQIKKALKDALKIKVGKLKGRPVEELIAEL